MCQEPFLVSRQRAHGVLLHFYEEAAATGRGHTRWCTQAVSRRAFPGNSSRDLRRARTAAQPRLCHAPWAVWVWVVISELLSSSKDWHRHRANPPGFYGDHVLDASPLETPFWHSSAQEYCPLGQGAGWAASQPWGKFLTWESWKAGVTTLGKSHWFWS